MENNLGTSMFSWEWQELEGVGGWRGFPGGASGKEPTCNAGDIRDTGLIPELRRSPGGRHGNPLQYSCLQNPMDRAWRATVHGDAKSRTRVKQFSMHAHMLGGVGKQGKGEFTSWCGQMML